MKYVAIDIGAGEIKIALKGRGIVYRNTSVAAVDSAGKTVKFGNEAVNAISRSPGALKLVYPFANGITANPDMAKAILSEFITAAIGRQLVKPCAIISVPCGLTKQEEEVISKIVADCGFRKVYTTDCGFSCCVAAGNDVFLPKSHLVVNIGASSTDISLVSMGSSVISESKHIGGYDIDRVIVAYVKNKYAVKLSMVSAEKIKLQIGTVYDDAPGSVELNYNGQAMPLTAKELSDGIFAVAKDIVAFIVDIVERIPTEHLLDVKNGGIMLSGGTAKLDGLAQMISDSTELAVTLSETPTEDAVTGCVMLSDRIGEFDSGNSCLSRQSGGGKFLQ